MLRDNDELWKAAQAIAGTAPAWLYDALQFYGRTVVSADRVTGEANRQADERLLQARKSITQLTSFLEELKPHLTDFFEADKFAVDVLLALEVLPRIAAVLPKFKARPRYRPGDQRYQTVAGVVVEGWRMTRRTEPTPGGHWEAEACRAYWRACGHDDAGGGRDWERDLRAAIRDGDPMVRSFLQMLADRAAATVA
jgi:hypothetical protein